MRCMTNSPMVGVRMKPEVRAALDDWCRANGVELSALLRNAALREIGREDLIDAMTGKGRPPKPKPAVKKPRAK